MLIIGMIVSYRYRFSIKSVVGLLAFAVLAGVLSVSTVRAQANLPFRRTTTAPSALELTPAAGDWLVMCYSFSSDDGKEQAIRLATELRERHRLKAYVFTRHFDLSDKLSKNTVGGWRYAEGREKKDGVIVPDKRMKPATKSQFSETAVMVGNSFESIDDPKAQAMLAKIKGLSPASLQQISPEELAEDDSRLRLYRAAIDRTGKPMGHAMLLTNPTLPAEYFKRKNVDDFILKMNRGVRYSLLKCPGKYSVRVATFRGKSTISPLEIQQQQQKLDWHKKNRKGIKSQLTEAFNKANVLTKTLRKNGVEAYEFHDRQESYVCVGSFEWLTRTDSNGQKIQNPAVREKILEYRGSSRQAGNQAVALSQSGKKDRTVNQIYMPKILPSLKKHKIAFDVQPLPVVVPQAPTVAWRPFQKLR